MISPNKILVSGQQMKRLYEKAFEDICISHEISQTEADILVFLANNPGFDTARDIAEIRMIAKSYISKSVENLIQKNYLVRVQDETDRRIIHLKLTDQALPIVENAKLNQKTFMKLLFEGMDVEEIQVFETLISKIFSNVDKAYKEMEKE